MADRDSRNLKDACVDEALGIIAERGLDGLSLREVARRLGVSHQAPYKHFPNRDHILAAVVARCFAEFSTALEARPPAEDPFEDLANMGLAYLAFARQHPLKYRLMFNTALPEPARHPEMLAEARAAFELLVRRLETVPLRDAGHPIADPVRHDAVFIWSALHGIASLMPSDAMATLGLSDAEKETAVTRLMRRLALALEPDTHE